MHETGCRAGEVLGLRHEDIAAAECEVTIVARENANGARAKSGGRTVPVVPELIRLYADYLHEEYGDLDSENRLRLGGGEDPRQLLRRLQRDRPAARGLSLADVVEERLPPSPPAGPPRGQQVPRPFIVAGLMRIEHAHRGDYVESEAASRGHLISVQWRKPARWQAGALLRTVRAGVLPELLTNWWS